MPGLFFGGGGARENHFKLTQGGGGGGRGRHSSRDVTLLGKKNFLISTIFLSAAICIV